MEVFLSIKIFWFTQVDDVTDGLNYININEVNDNEER